MEVIFLLIGIAIFWGVIRLAIRSGTRTVKAAARTATGSGTFAENISVEFKGMGPFEIRTIRTKAGENNDGPEIIEVQGRGLIPVYDRLDMSFVTSVFDSTGGAFEPVLSTFDEFQEPASIAYQHVVGVGEVEPNIGFPNWVRVGVVIPDLLVPPESGRRNLSIALRLVDQDDPPNIFLGRADSDHDGMIAIFAETVEETFTIKGYKEAAEHREQARSLSIKLGMAVAMADEDLDDSEGVVIQNWIVKTLSLYEGDKKDELKEKYNAALREAYQEVQDGTLSLGALIEEMNEFADQPEKYEAIELCFDVMAADGVADEAELNTIRGIAESLELDYDEITKLRDQKLVELDAVTEQQASIESILDLDTEAPKEEILKQLREEYTKWNARLNTLEEGRERNNAQQILDLLAEARKKYA